MPLQDSHQRTVIYVDEGKQKTRMYARNSILRVLWYVYHQALLREQTMSRGIVILINCTSASLDQYDRKFFKKMYHSILHSFPVKVRAIHLCNPGRAMEFVLPVVKYFLDKNTRARFVVHQGNKEVVLEELNTFGLDLTKLPVHMGGYVPVPDIMPQV
mmetsp:Transcript_3898/g.5811  ORF Transcript_3898/g.5811 Transcript_3898/m.5811 type:complete len:158 (+) Transcript_3898:613-1086(+)